MDLTFALQSHCYAMVARYILSFLSLELLVIRGWYVVPIERGASVDDKLGRLNDAASSGRAFLRYSNRLTSLLLRPVERGRLLLVFLS